MWRNDIWREILYMEDDSRKRICGTCGEECNIRIMWYGADDRRKRICGEEHRGSQPYSFCKFGEFLKVLSSITGMTL